MKKCLLFCAALILVAIACTSDPVKTDDPKSTKPDHLNVTLVAGQPVTKTVLVEQGGELHPWWSADDGITVISVPGGTNAFGAFDFGNNLEGSGATAEFSGTLNEYGEYIAVYPQNLYIESYSFQYGSLYCYFTLPSVQYPTLTSFDPDADLLISDPFAVTEDNEVDGRVLIEGVSFTRVNAILKVILQDQTEDKRLNGETVRKVTVSHKSISDEGGQGEEPIMNATLPTKADVYDNDEQDYSTWRGLAGSIELSFTSDNKTIYRSGYESVTAVYDSQNYQIGDDGAATYVVTFPCILRNGERYDSDAEETVFDDGLHIRVETDDLVIDRNVVLPDNGIALQPSLVTTLNIKLYDDGVKGTTIQTIGMALNKESVSMKPGKAMQLEAQFVGINPTIDELESLVWTSSNNSIVKVEPVVYNYGGGEVRSGSTASTNLATITALSEGTATITATYQGRFVATCEVTVEMVPEQPSEMVDLGLSSGTKWAQWNLGAQSWDQEGDQYAWGETQYKSEFTWNNYKWADGTNRLTKYTMSAVYSSDNQIDNTFLMALCDDAANANWGPDWYIPTTEQWEELKNECEWDYIYDDDDNLVGYSAKGPSGNSISFPSYGSDGYTLNYLSSLLPLPTSGDVSNALSSYSIPVDVRTYWSQEQGTHNMCENYMYFCDRGTGAAFVRPVSAGLEMRKEPYLGAITLESSGGAVKASFPVYESEREKAYREDPNYVLYSVTAVIFYSTDPDYEPGRYSHSHMPYDTGTSSNAHYVKFSIDDIKENKVCSFVPEGMTGTIYYRAYYYSTVKEYVGQTTSIIVDEYYGVTRSITIP